MNDDEFNDDLDLEGESFDSFEGGKSAGGAEGLREKPVVKIAIVLGIVVAVVGGLMFFQKDDTVSMSSVPTASDVTAAPGTEEASSAYVDAVKEADQQRLEQAEREGGSALPTPIAPPVGRIDLSLDGEEEEDPLQRWKRLQQERIQREEERAALLQPESLEDQSVSAEAIQAMAEAMSTQMQLILNSKESLEVRSLSVTSPDFLEDLEQENVQAQAQIAAATQNTQSDVAEILLPAGEIVYAQLLTEANSDTPGPVLARIDSGPLRGSRVLGSFQVQNDYMVLSFNTLVKDGISSSIDAVSLDPETTLPGMATEVDHRYLRKIILPAASAFIEGAAEAIANTGQTTITIQGDTVTSEEEDQDNEEEISAGVAEAAAEVSEILDEIADDTETLVRIESGTPIGLLFLQPVLKEEE